MLNLIKAFYISYIIKGKRKEIKAKHPSVEQKESLSNNTTSVIKHVNITAITISKK
jgi:hypothetical protein